MIFKYLESTITDRIARHDYPKDLEMTNTVHCLMARAPWNGGHDFWNRLRNHRFVRQAGSLLSENCFLTLQL